MGIDRKMRKAQEKSEKKERKEVEKQLKKEAKELKKQAKERGKAIADARNGSEALQSEIAVTTDVMSSLSDIENKSEEAIINNLCNFSTYGELREQLLNAKVLFKKFSKTKKHKLSKSGKKGCEQVKTKAKEWLDLADAWEKRISKTNSPSAPIATAEFPYYEEMRRYQRALTAMEHDRAAGFTGRLETLALYPTNSKEYIKKGTKEIRNLAPYKSKINRLLGTRAAAEALDDNLDYAHHFLEHAVEGTLTHQDMIFYNTHGNTIREICQGTEFPEMIDMAYRSCSITPAQYRTGFNGMNNFQNRSLSDASKGGIFGCFKRLFDKTNMSQQTSNKYSNIATLVTLAAGARGAYKLASYKSESGRTTAKRIGLGVLAGQVISQAATGKGFLDNIKGMLYGGDNFISKLFNFAGGLFTGDDTPEITPNATSNGASQDLLNNFYQQYDHNNQVLALPLMFPGRSVLQVEQAISAFEQTPTTWTQFRQNFLLKHQNTIPGAVADTYLPEQFDRAQFITWLQTLGVTIPASPEHQNDKIEDLILQNFILKSLNDNGYQLAAGKNPKELVDYLKKNNISEVQDAFAKLTEEGFIQKKQEVVDKPIDYEKLKDSIPVLLENFGYKIATGKNMDDIINYIKSDKDMPMLLLSDSVTMILKKLKDQGLIEKDENSDQNNNDDSNDDIMDDIEIPETPDKIIAHRKPIRKEHLDRCNNLSETNKNAVLKAMENLVRNDNLAQKYGISIEDGRFNIRGALNPVSGYNYEKFSSVGEETHIHLEKQAIDDYEDRNGTEIQANSYEELIGTAHFINKIRSKYKNRESKQFSLAADNRTLILNGYQTDLKLPEIPFITQHKDDFIRSLNASSGLLSTRVG